MKTRLLWIAIFAVGLTALYCGIMRPTVTSIPSEIRESISDLKPPLPPPIEPPLLQIPPTPTLLPPPLRPVARFDPVPGPPEVPIQDKATIDFSTGVPVVKPFSQDQLDLEKAMKEMTDAAKGLKIEAKK